VPAKTPAAIVQRLHREITAITRTPEMQKTIADAGLEPRSTTPAETEALVRKDAQAMERLIKAKGIKLE
jgi:tripartite-type tricarboxylate transporter receptor subunit TctC